MSINNPTFQLPRDWTAEQAEFISAILEDLTHAIWETYEDNLIRLWQDRDGLVIHCDAACHATESADDSTARAGTGARVRRRRRYSLLTR